MKLLVTGASGLIGTALGKFLNAAGHTTIPLRRGETEEPCWDPEAEWVNLNGMTGIDGVIHLAGESLQGRWGAAKKKRILDSRVKGTRLVAETLARMQPRPKVFISASAVGFYGHRGDQVVDETSSSGQGFLAEVCRQWEAAAAPAADAGIRVVHPRMGVVLSPNGGMLKALLLPFKLGIGGVVGDGRQYLSWITIGDVNRIIAHILTTESIAGPVNLSTPNPVTNKQFTKTLGRVIRRPTVAPLPAYALKFALGEMADEMLLNSIRAVPTRVTASGYCFQHSELEGALRHLMQEQ